MVGIGDDVGSLGHGASPGQHAGSRDERGLITHKFYPRRERPAQFQKPCAVSSSQRDRAATPRFRFFDAGLRERFTATGAGHRTHDRQQCARSARKILDVAANPARSYADVVERGTKIVAGLVDRYQREAAQTIVGLLEAGPVRGRDGYHLAASILDKVGYAPDGERWSHRYPVWDVVDHVGAQLGDEAAGRLLSCLDRDERIDACMHMEGARTARLFLRGNAEVQEAFVAALNREGGPDLGEYAQGQVAREVLPRMERLAPGSAADLVYALGPEIGREVLRLVPKVGLLRTSARAKIASDIAEVYRVNPAELDLRYQAEPDRDEVPLEILPSEKKLIDDVRNEIGLWRRQLGALSPERIEVMLLWLKENTRHGDFRWVGAHVLDALPSKDLLADAICDLNELDRGGRFVPRETRGRHLARSVLRTRVELLARRAVFDARMVGAYLWENWRREAIVNGFSMAAAGVVPYGFGAAVQAGAQQSQTNQQQAQEQQIYDYLVRHHTMNPHLSHQLLHLQSLSGNGAWDLVPVMIGVYAITNVWVRGGLQRWLRERVPAHASRRWLRACKLSPGSKRRKSRDMAVVPQAWGRGVTTAVIEGGAKVALGAVG